MGEWLKQGIAAAAMVRRYDVKKQDLLMPQYTWAPESEEGFKEGLPVPEEGIEAIELKKRRAEKKKDIYKLLHKKIEEQEQYEKKRKARADAEMIMQPLRMRKLDVGAIHKEELGQGWNAAKYCVPQCSPMCPKCCRMSEEGVQDLLSLLDCSAPEEEGLTLSEYEAIERKKLKEEQKKEEQERDISQFLQAFKSGNFDEPEAIIPKEKPCQWWLTEDFRRAQDEHLYGRFQDLPSWVDLSCCESQDYAKGMEHVAQKAFRFILNKTQGKQYKVRPCA